MEMNQEIKNEVKALENEINRLIIELQNKYPTGYLTIVPVTEDHSVFNGESIGPIQLLELINDSDSSSTPSI
ncbi:hypothetical protein Mucpa_1692 [Mucilaginibacter paludis DSM 18603]|uniref:Uncharacterized protein n=1 Tax=Mucilaginibacter paludis DSM 18603 TaxID=714943 RepID=H1Y6K3_9SPHI|nr:hypothetical protein Mucpa_1692 [Mucilaginibacter paludis DSM 18603]